MAFTSSVKAPHITTTFAAIVHLLCHTTGASARALYANMEVESRAVYAGTEAGCYSTAGGNMQVAGTNIYQSSGKCGAICANLGKPVMALQEDSCLCGDLKPSPGSKLATSSCSTFCPGYDAEPCGGPSAYTIWLTGVDDSVGSVGSSKASNNDVGSSSAPMASSSAPYTSSQTSSTSSTRSTHPPTRTNTHSKPTQKPHPKSSSKPNGKQPPKSKVYTTTEDQTTVVKTVISSPSDSPDANKKHTSSSKSSTPSTIGIAVGVIAGVIFFAAMIAGVLFYLRRRRRTKNAENGHRRAESLNAFVAAGGHLPGTNPSKVPTVTVNDARLDPRIMQETRRASVGSFLADNQDYSRRILKVTNPDGT